MKSAHAAGIKTFYVVSTLRKGVKWVDQNGNEKGEVTAKDFLNGTSR